uniref:Uncharacterized protein n=1 Tax=Anopheles atroparvus TaxID=41427 RepID=A0AAG5D520_ANOAO
MLCQCHFALVVVSLVSLAAECGGSSSEYLIIRHGRSRVRHSSEKDHIRWGLQVFDNFTLLDYDASGGGGTASAARNANSDTSETADTSTTWPTSGDATPGPSPVTVHPPPKEGKLIKKEIMENIRRTVDKGLEYLKSHRNLDEVKIELVPYRSAAKRSHSRRKVAREPPSAPEAADNDAAVLDDTSEPSITNNHRSKRPEVEPFWPTGGVVPILQPTPSSGSNVVEPSLSTVERTSERQKNAHEVPGGRDDGNWNAGSDARVDDGRVFASNQRLISLGALPGRASDVTAPAAFPPSRGDAEKTMREHPAPHSSELSAGQNVLDLKATPEVKLTSLEGSTVRPWPTGEVDYPNDDDDAANGAAVDADRASAYVESPEGDGEMQDGRLDSAQDDDPLLQEAEEIEVNGEVGNGDEGVESAVDDVDVTNIFHMEESDLSGLDETSRNNRRNLMKGRDVVTQFLQIVESQHLLGANCTAGTALNLGEGVVDRYAQDRFRIEAEIAVNRANMLTRPVNEMSAFISKIGSE